VKGLVLSGGGAKGAYQVGVLRRWLGEEQRKYDIICGVSVGALNGSFLAQYPIGQEKLASIELTALWAGIDTAAIYKKWFGWEVAALWKSSVYNSAPLQRLVREKLNLEKVRSSGKKLRVGAASLTNGRYVLFGEDHPKLHDAILASSSFPAMLSPIEIDGELWTDGGVRDVTPLSAAIKLGADTVDVVLCSSPGVDHKFPKKPNALKVAARALDIMSDEVIENDLKLVDYVNRLVKVNAAASGKRHIDVTLVRPKNSLTDNSLDFSPAGLRRMIEQGYNDAIGV